MEGKFDIWITPQKWVGLIIIPVDFIQSTDVCAMPSVQAQYTMLQTF